jgi:hypothetical protein
VVEEATVAEVVLMQAMEVIMAVENHLEVEDVEVPTCLTELLHLYLNQGLAPHMVQVESLRW